MDNRYPPLHIGGWGALHALAVMPPMNKVASRAVVADAGDVERLTEFRFILAVARRVAEFMDAVRKLTATLVGTTERFLESAAQFRFIAEGSRGTRHDWCFLYTL
jgi:hypothetical protein